MCITWLIHLGVSCSSDGLHVEQLTGVILNATEHDQSDGVALPLDDGHDVLRPYSVFALKQPIDTVTELLRQHDIIQTGRDVITCRGLMISMLSATSIPLSWIWDSMAYCKIHTQTRCFYSVIDDFSHSLLRSLSLNVSLSFVRLKKHIRDLTERPSPPEEFYGVLKSVCRRKAERIIKRGEYCWKINTQTKYLQMLLFFTMRRCRLTVSPFIRATSSGLAPV